MLRRQNLRWFLIVLAVVLALTWYSQQARCATELVAWTQLHSALITAKTTESQGDRYAGVERSQQAVRRYCDTPFWAFWEWEV